MGLVGFVDRPTIGARSAPVREVFWTAIKSEFRRWTREWRLSASDGAEHSPHNSLLLMPRAEPSHCARYGGTARRIPALPGETTITLTFIPTMPALKTLRELLVDELRDLHNAENQLVKALPKMAKAASHDELKEGFEEHLEQTRDHVDRLDRCFKILGAAAKGKTCHAMKGLVEEGKEAIEEDAPDAIRDAKLIGAAQRVEHYEIAAYGTARAFAQTLGETKVADLLQATLDEEGETDKKLTALAETINEEAHAIDQEEEEEQ